MSHGGCETLPRGVMSLSSVCDCGISCHTQLLFLIHSVEMYIIFDKILMIMPLERFSNNRCV